MKNTTSTSQTYMQVLMMFPYTFFNLFFIRPMAVTVIIEELGTTQGAMVAAAVDMTMVAAADMTMGVVVDTMTGRDLRTTGMAAAVNTTMGRGWRTTAMTEVGILMVAILAEAILVAISEQQKSNWMWWLMKKNTWTLFPYFLTDKIYLFTKKYYYQSNCVQFAK